MPTRAARVFVVAILALGLTARADGAVPRAPSIAAKSWLLVDQGSGQVLAAREAERPLSVAGLSRLALAWVMFERLRADDSRLVDPVNVSERAVATRGARLFLRAGETVDIGTLLRGVLAVSANDAAIALAEHVAGGETAFVERMNALAPPLGLHATRFGDVTGLGAGRNLSSARDLARLAAHLWQEFPQYRSWFSVREFTHGGLRQYNQNALLWRDAQVNGLMAAHSADAGYCLIASAVRGDMHLVAVVLGATSEDARVQAAQQLLEFGFRHYETRRLYDAGAVLAQARVRMGAVRALPLETREAVMLTLPRGWHERVQARTTVEREPLAPIRAGESFGALRLELDGEILAEYALVARRDVRPGNIFQRWRDRFLDWID